MLITKWLTTFGKYLILMGRSFSRPERLRMFLKQYVKEMSQLGVNSIGIVLLILLQRQFFRNLSLHSSKILQNFPTIETQKIAQLAFPVRHVHRVVSFGLQLRIVQIHIHNEIQRADLLMGHVVFRYRHIAPAHFDSLKRSESHVILESISPIGNELWRSVARGSIFQLVLNRFEEVF